MRQQRAPDPPPHRAADAAARIFFWIVAYLFLGFIFLRSWHLAHAEPGADASRIDLIVFWAAARLALAGDALGAFDPATLFQASGLVGEPPEHFLWLYPPAYLALVAPLGALPFWAAWNIVVLSSAAGLALAARGPAAPVPGGWRLVVVAPVMVLSVLLIGQNSALWTAALLAGLWALRQRRTRAAGLWIGLLTLKPHLCLLLPVALVAGREWRTIAWASAAAILLVLASTLVFGPAYWPAFLAGIAELGARAEAGAFSSARVVSVYAFARALGLEHGAALWVQMPATAALAATVAAIWSRRSASDDLKAAALCAAIPLATPYAFYYETILLLVAGVFLVRNGFGRGLAGKLWLFVLWCGPIPMVYMSSLPPPALVAPPVAMITLAICLARAWRARAAPWPVLHRAPAEDGREASGPT